MELPAPTRHVYHADGYVLIWSVNDYLVHVVRLPSPLRGVTLATYEWEWVPSDSANIDLETITVCLDVERDVAMFLAWSSDGDGRFVVLRPCSLTLSYEVSAHLYVCIHTSF